MPDKHHDMSPSKFELYKACPGSARFKEAPDAEPSQPAIDGTMMHDILSGDLDQAETLAGRDDIAEISGLLDDMRADVDMFTEGQPFEKEKWIQLLNDDFEDITAGTADVVQVLPDKVRILDYKTGRVWVSPTSLQLKVYAACAMQTYDRDVAEVAISQPRAGGMKPAMFTDFDSLYAEIEAIITACKAENPVFCAGEHCTKYYCPGRMNCSVRVASQDDAVVALAKREVELMSPENIGAMAKKATAVKKVCDEIVKRCKELTIAGEATGYKIIEKQGNRYIADAQKAVAVLASVIPQEQIVKEIVSLPFGKLCKLYVAKKKEEGMKKGEAEKELETILGDNLQRQKASQSCVEE